MAWRGGALAWLGAAWRGEAGTVFSDRESEASARKGRQGPLVREGLMTERVSFRYDVERYGEALEKVVKTAQFTAPVVVNGKRILRTRAKFDCPWSVVGVADVDEELVDKAKLTAWLARGGRRIGKTARGLGDWRRRLRPVRRRGRDRAGRRGVGAFPPGPAGQGRHARQG